MIFHLTISLFFFQHSNIYDTTIKFQLSGEKNFSLLFSKSKFISSAITNKIDSNGSISRGKNPRYIP